MICGSNDIHAVSELVSKPGLLTVLSALAVTQQLLVWPAPEQLALHVPQAMVSPSSHASVSGQSCPSPQTEPEPAAVQFALHGPHAVWCPSSQVSPASTMPLPQTDCTQLPPVQFWFDVHGLHVAPPMPQVGPLEVWHWPAESQHPFGHDVASQTHLVPLQRCPLAQTAHVPPAVPQAATVSLVVQVPALLQHPLGHEVASQTQVVPLQRCPMAQTAHVPPAVPHAATVSLVVQVVALLQQPFAHDVAVQTH